MAVSKLLRKGHKITYVADAVVRHSHRYSLGQEFRRSFDTGLARQGYGHLLACDSSDSKRGSQFFKEMTKQLLKQQPHLIPYAFAQTLCKWTGYQLGRISLKGPLWLKKTCSSQDFYWVSDDFLAKHKK